MNPTSPTDSPHHRLLLSLQSPRAWWSWNASRSRRLPRRSQVRVSAGLRGGGREGCPRVPMRPGGSSPWALGRTLSLEETWPKETSWWWGRAAHPALSKHVSALIFPTALGARGQDTEGSQNPAFYSVPQGRVQSLREAPPEQTLTTQPLETASQPRSELRANTEANIDRALASQSSQALWGTPHAKEGSTACGGAQGDTG